MRLIDADALIKDIELSRNNNIHREARIKMNHETEHRHFLKIVAEQPTAFDKDKVIAELSTLRQAEYDDSDEEPEFTDVDDALEEGQSQGRYQAYFKAIEVVEKGGTE